MSLFHFQKNFAESSYCFSVAITFLHQPSTLTCRHVLNFAAVKRARPSPTPHHASPKSALAVSPPFLFSALVAPTYTSSIFVRGPLLSFVISLLFAVQSIAGYDQWKYATKDKIFRVYSAMVMLFLKILEGKVMIHTFAKYFFSNGLQKHRYKVQLMGKNC